MPMVVLSQLSMLKECALPKMLDQAGRLCMPAEGDGRVAYVTRGLARTLQAPHQVLVVSAGRLSGSYCMPRTSFSDA